MNPKTMYEDYKSCRGRVINGIYRDSKTDKIYEAVDVHPTKRSGHRKEDVFEAIPCDSGLNRLSDEPYTSRNVSGLRYVGFLETIALRETKDFLRIASRINPPEAADSKESSGEQKHRENRYVEN